MTGADDYARTMLTRTGTDRLPAHLAATYGTEVTSVSKLDLGVFQVHRTEGAPWVARVFPAARPAGAAAGDAAVLDFLADAGFPAELPASPRPVSVLDRQDVLVTGYVEAVPRDRRSETIRRLGGFIRLGAMLSRLHTLPGARDAVTRPGGAWHHLADGAPRDEIAAAATLLTATGAPSDATDRTAYESLREHVARFDGGDGLPEALIHPDFVLANAIASPEDRMVMVDWTGAGIGPRLWSLAFLLYSAGARRPDLVRSVVKGYTRHLRPEPAELDRLAAVMCVRPSILELWSFCTGRQSAADAARALTEIGDLSATLATRAREEFEAVT